MIIQLIAYQQLYDKGPCFSYFYCGNFYIYKHSHHIRSGAAINLQMNSNYDKSPSNWSFVQTPNGTWLVPLSSIFFIQLDAKLLIFLKLPPFSSATYSSRF